MTTLSPLLVKVASRAVRFGPFRIAAPVAALAERSVNARTQPYNGDREAASRSPALPVDRAAIHAATMHKVAEVSRALKSVVSLIETLVQTASGGSDLTLAHWLIPVSLCRAYTCKQSDLHSETGIAAGYLTRLIDELDKLKSSLDRFMAVCAPRDKSSLRTTK